MPRGDRDVKMWKLAIAHDDDDDGFGTWHLHIRHLSSSLVHVYSRTQSHCLTPRAFADLLGCFARIFDLDLNDEIVFVSKFGRGSRRRSRF